MPTDLETEIRTALQARADAVVPRRTAMAAPARRPRHLLLVAAAVLAVVAIAVPLALLHGSNSNTEGPATGGTGYVGFAWHVVTIEDRQGRLDVPSTLQTSVEFPQGGGHVGGSDGVNYNYASMELVSDGYVVSDPSTTLAGYAGRDPAVLRTIAAIDALFWPADGSTQPLHVTASLQGDTLTLSAGGVTVTATRSAPMATPSPPSPTNTPSATASPLPVTTAAPTSG